MTKASFERFFVTMTETTTPTPPYSSLSLNPKFIEIYENRFAQSYHMGGRFHLDRDLMGTRLHYCKNGEGNVSLTNR